jgi:hypothetical protein
VFKAPHLIIKQSHKKSRFYAAVLDYDAVFNHSLLGIHGDERLLKYLCIIVNSRLFSYYQMLTNRKWLVERDELEAGDIWNTPIPSPDSVILAESAELYRRLAAEGHNDESVQEFVSKIYNLQGHEKELIKDSFESIYNYFNQKGKSLVFKIPSQETYRLYYDTLVDILKNTSGQSLVHESHLYAGESPLSVLMLSLDGKHTNSFQVHRETRKSSNY